jgi:antitoxin YefM
MTVSASDARRRLYPLIREVNEDSTSVTIVSAAGNAVLVSETEWLSLQETAYLLRSPVNAARLTAALAAARVEEGSIVGDLDAL